jgi:SAM-dependent methyltransferase
MSKLRVELDSQIGEDIEKGELICPNGCRYPIVNSIPRFVDRDKYADSFSRQRLYVRRHIEHYLKDSSGDALFESSTGFELGRLRSGITLEVGCGYGRFLDVVERFGGEVVGVDLSTHSIELARDFVGNRPSVHFVQADLFKLPFETGSFDHVFSIGVLHHTPDTKAALNATVPYVASGGEIAIWVYPVGSKQSDDRWRYVTRHLPHPVLYGFCIVNQLAFSWIRGLPGGWRFSRIIPGCGPSGGHFWLRVMSDFDSLSPKYARTHAADEVESWLEDAGLVDIQRLSRATAIKGRMPSKL